MRAALNASLAWIVALLAAPLAAAEPVSFTRDVMPVLTKAGCNAGACHGSFQGRGRFRLSLLGFDPRADYEAIAVHGRGRRVLPGSPANSLLLRKATGVMPHGGGVRLSTDSPGYQTLLDFISQGLPPPPVGGPVVKQLDVTPAEVVLKPGQSVAVSVQARWSDGVVRDATAWSLYDSLDPGVAEVTPTGAATATAAGKTAVSVRYLGQVASVRVSVPFGPPQRFEFSPANYIDEHLAAEWQKLGLAPTALTTDGEFIRRASLDLIGTLPTNDEVRAFVASTNADKRSQLVDDLLKRPEYADYWSLKWGDLLRVHRRYVGDKGLGSFQGWLRRSLRENKPLDAITRELLTSQGNLFAHGPVAYYVVDQKPEELAETTAQLFLGVRLQCARCHHHPMEVWGQDDYYGLAAFFTRLEIRDTGDKGRFGGMQIVRPTAAETRTLAVPSQPKLLGAGSITPAGSADPRVALADWITRADNPYFARNLANRYWAYVMGRGLIDPIDDLRATNPPVYPDLLDALARDLAEHGFDPQYLLRTICTSRAYQLQADLAPACDRDGRFFTHRIVRRLPAEVFLDAINQVAGVEENFAGTPPKTRAIALPDPTVTSDFLTTFGRPQRNSTCECARESSPDLLQALHLINNAALQAKIANSQGRVARLLAAGASDEVLAGELYLAAIARPPSAEELAAIKELTAASAAAERQLAWEDVLWSLVNSPEFAFQH